MLGEGGTNLLEFEAAARKFLARDERGGIDMKRYRGIIDALDGDFASEARDAQKAGAHLATGNITAASNIFVVKARLRKMAQSTMWRRVSSSIATMAVVVPREVVSVTATTRPTLFIGRAKG